MRPTWSKETLSGRWWWLKYRIAGVYWRWYYRNR
jgi:hypothetical protein